uniref:Uncharacterized protein n=1 Tax=Anguilla anguilla TaxID=7936 RepID=A0A0E9UA24_ANGAN
MMTNPNSASYKNGISLNAFSQTSVFTQHTALADCCCSGSSQSG